MNKEEIGLFNDLWNIGTDMMSQNYKEPADELKEKIIKTFEENKQLKEKLKKCRKQKEKVENACGNYKYILNKINQYLIEENNKAKEITDFHTKAVAMAVLHEIYGKIFVLEEGVKDNEQLRNDINYYKNFNKRLQKENQELKKQLEQMQYKVGK